MNVGFALELEGKGVTDDGAFEGYASTFNNMDMGGDIVAPGAFTKSLASQAAVKVKMLRDHDPRMISGVWSAMAEDAKGLRVKGQLLLDTQLGRETHVLMKAGALDSLSIGYRTIKAGIDRKTGGRLLQQVDLKEISILPFGMNPKALITAVKSDNPARARTIAAAIQRAAEALRAR